MKQKLALYAYLILIPFTAFADTNGADGARSTTQGVVTATSDGATTRFVRTPVVFKPFTITASAAETTVWTPANGKKFRLMGWSLFSDTATILNFRDNTAGTTIYRTGVGANANIHPSGIGNGILSAAANNVLTLQATTAATISGTVFGTEE